MIIRGLKLRLFSLTPLKWRNKVWIRTHLIPLYADADGDEDAGGKADMADALWHVEHLDGDSGVMTKGNGAHQQVGQKEHHVSQTQADQ